MRLGQFFFSFMHLTFPTIFALTLFNKRKRHNSSFFFFLILFLLSRTNSTTIYISSCTDLQKINKNASCTFQLTKNLDCVNANFLPLCQTNAFTGILDGNGMTIFNLNINQPSTINVGLLGYGSSCDVFNLTISNVNVSGNCQVGALFGKCDTCNIHSVVLTSSTFNNVTGMQNDVGGLIGLSCGATMLSNCAVSNTTVTSLTLYYVGGMVGKSDGNINISNCFNLGFPASPDSAIVEGSYAGGIIGFSQMGTVFSQCGVSSGKIISSTCAGSIAAHLYQPSNLSQLYASSSVFVTSYGGYGGGLVGQICVPSLLTLQESYSRATLVGSTGSVLGGLVGDLNFNSGGIFLVHCSYTSFNFSGNAQMKGNVVGDVRGNVSSLFFTKVFFNNENGVTALGNGTPTFKNPTGYNCSSLWNNIQAVFDQNNAWTGSNLKSEYFSIYGSCSLLCSNGCSPTTTLLSTNFLTSSFPSSSPPTSTSPTVAPLASLSPTNVQRSSLPSSSTTNVPSSVSSTSPPSSPPATREVLLTTLSVSSLSSTSFAPSVFPFVCFYQVPNCTKCDPNPPQFDSTQVNVSCSLSSGVWKWSFVAISGTVKNDHNLTVNSTSTVIQGNLANGGQVEIIGNSSIFVEGNFTQNSQGQIVVTIDTSQNNNGSSLNVGGCVSINGNISLNLETQPQQGTTNLQIISYNCSQQVNISSSQIQVIPNYNGSSCDTINSQTTNQPGSLGVSITSTLGNKCNGGNNLGLIIGISVGVPVATAIAVTVAVLLTKKSSEKEAMRIVKERELREVRASATNK